jgi:hypothetical protein
MQKIIPFFILSTAVTLCLSISSNVFAQRGKDIKYTYHDEIYAPSLTKRWNDFNLKGKVKTVETVLLAKSDTTLHEFTNSGLLLRSRAPSQKARFGHEATTTYRYRNKQLYKILTTSPVSSFSNEELFGYSGYLEKSTISYKDGDPRFYQEAYFEYSNNGSHLDIQYDYRKPSKTWDLVRSRSYDFTFDAKKRVTMVEHKSKRSESSYGGSMSHLYDSISGKLYYASYRDDCAGSNSCLILDMELSYDDRGNIIYEKQLDLTIRNALWSDSYTYFARYNEQNDIAEEYRKMIKEPFQDKGILFQDKGILFRDKGILPILKKEPPPLPADYHQLKKVYTYEYDSNGNWIKKYEITGGSKTLISSRTINYFD